MRRQLVDILVCPVCKGDLELTTEESCRNQIIKGSLNCPSCDLQYTIKKSIPNLLPPHLA
jgi:uncharacterized protein YbaR (Trm112 family)